MFGLTGAPRFRGPTRVPKNVMRSKLPPPTSVSKNKENIKEKKLVESMHYCIHKFLMYKHEKISSFLQRLAG